MKDNSRLEDDVVRVTAEPGVCGFPCVIEARKETKRSVSVRILDSECQQIQSLSRDVKVIALGELFNLPSRNPVYISAQRAGCHASCPIPMAVLKAVEVAMDMALPRDVVIRFES